MNSIEKRKEQSKENHRIRIGIIDKLGLHDTYIDYYKSHTNVAIHKRSQRFCALLKIDWKKINEANIANVKKILALNFDMNVDHATAKGIIEMRNRYKYFDFDYKTIKEIAEKDFADISWRDAAMIIQCLHPSLLVCSGLFDSFLLFEMTDDGVRIDLPIASWKSLTWRQNEDYANTHLLIQDILDLFSKYNIIAHTSWHELLDTAIQHDEERKASR